MASPYREVVLTPYLSRRQAADYLGCTERTIDRYIADQKIEAKRVGKRMIRIPLTSIEALLSQDVR